MPVLLVSWPRELRGTDVRISAGTADAWLCVQALWGAVVAAAVVARLRVVQISDVLTSFSPLTWAVMLAVMLAVILAVMLAVMLALKLQMM